MPSGPALLYATLASMTVAIIAEVIGLLPAIAPTAPEGLRVVGGASTTLSGFVFGWTYVHIADSDQEGYP